MAPEIYMTQQYGHEVDVWALGVVLYELFHGMIDGDFPGKKD